MSLQELYEEYFHTNKKSFYKLATPLNPFIRLCIKNSLALDYQPVRVGDNYIVELTTCDHGVEICKDDIRYYDTHMIKCQECIDDGENHTVEILYDENRLHCVSCDRQYQREVGKLKYNIATFKCFCKKGVSKQHGEMRLFDHLQLKYGVENVYCNYVHQEPERNRRTSDFYVKIDDSTIVIELVDVSHIGATNKNSDIVKMNLILEQEGDSTKMVHIDQAFLPSIILENRIETFFKQVLEEEHPKLSLMFHRKKSSIPVFKHILSRDDVYKCDIAE